MVEIYGLGSGAAEMRERAKAAAAVAAAHAAEVDEQGRFPDEGVQALAEQGLMGLTVSTAVGGAGHDMRSFVAVVEELGKTCASTAMVYVMHVAATQVIAGSSTLTDRDAVLRDIAAGAHLTTLAFSEKGSRSLFWLPVSRLERRNGQLATSAQKSWVTSANRAQSYVSTAQMPDAGSPLESTLYLARRDDPRIRVVARFNGLGLRGNDSAPVSIDDLAISDGDLLTEHGGGLNAILQVVLPWFAVGTAALAHGLCLAVVEATAGHLQQGRFDVGGEALRDLPNLRARLAEMSVLTEQSRALLGHTLDHLETPSDVTPLYVLQSRAAALKASWQVTDLAMQTCGGAAFSRHLAIERYFRDARAGWVMAPTTDHLLDFVGKAMTGLPLV